MKHYRGLSIAVLLLLQGACTLGGAPTRPSQFYVLSTDPGTPVAQRSASNLPLSLGIGPVALPDILDRPQIVTRLGENRIELGEFDRWGGDINEDLVRVLAQNLMARLNTDSVYLYPWQRSDNPDYQIVIRFFRFDGQLGNDVVLSGTWQLLDGVEGCRLQMHRFDIREPSAGADYAQLVSAMSAGVAKLSQTIAQNAAAATPGCNSR